LVKVRNCALEGATGENSRPVWARGPIVSRQCPKSVISSASLYWLEKFRWWKLTGSGPLWEMDAKCADALLLLNEEWQKEMENGKF
jgi:hypothetical protein